MKLRALCSTKNVAPTTAKTNGAKVQRNAASAPAIAIKKIGTVIAGK